MARGFRPVEVREDASVSAWRARLDRTTKHGAMLAKSYQHAVEMLRTDFLHGEPVPVPRDPRFEGLANLRCEDLAGSYRLLYSNIRIEEGTIAFIVTVVSHPEYDRLFGVRKR